VNHDSFWFDQRIAEENAKLKPPAPVTETETAHAIETRGDAVYLSFPHLNLILILDQKFYTNTLRGLLKTLTAVLTIQTGRVFVRYIRRDITHPLERLVVARTEDYWSVKVRDTKTHGIAPVIFDYRASNIIVEKSADDRTHSQWLTEEDKRNFAKPDRMFALRSDITGDCGTDTGLHRINQLFDPDFISDSHSKNEKDQEKPNRPKGYGSDEKGETEEGDDWKIGLLIRGDAGVNRAGEETGEERPATFTTDH
jgi:hypothetical protein